MNDIVTFVDTLNLDSASAGRLLNQLTDIENRKVKPQMVESYCKSLGWDGVPEHYANLLMWRTLQQTIDEVSGEAEEGSGGPTDDRLAELTMTVRRLLLRLVTEANNGVEDPDANNMTIEELYAYVAAALQTREERGGTQEPTAAVSAAVNNLMVGFLRSAGFSDSELSEMSLSEMAGAIELRMKLLRHISDTLSA